MKIIKRIFSYMLFCIFATSLVLHQAIYANEDICIICQDNISNRDNGEKKDLSCGHYFHQNCIEDWYIKGRRRDCPLCKHPIEDETFTQLDERRQREQQKQRDEELLEYATLAQRMQMHLYSSIPNNNSSNSSNRQGLLRNRNYRNRIRNQIPNLRRQRPTNTTPILHTQLQRIRNNQLTRNNITSEQTNITQINEPKSTIPPYRRGHISRNINSNLVNESQKINNDNINNTNLIPERPDPRNNAITSIINEQCCTRSNFFEEITSRGLVYAVTTAIIVHLLNKTINKIIPCTISPTWYAILVTPFTWKASKNNILKSGSKCLYTFVKNKLFG